ncbi:hypothetical protein KIW84_041715 [Lathyrus oleraceus]|uniref:Integrase catalytic domain-containing protein n=1 Tax=Pisum sativum TaxID=3888 RepID=A0A9D5ASF1_PEA|nr:hypothetical protein KIW84_041715 [Pisum sativum]
MSKLMGFDFEIKYKESCENKAADTLSRVHDAQLLPLLLSNAKEGLLEDIKASWSADPVAHNLIAELKKDPQSHPKFTRSNHELRLTWEDTLVRMLLLQRSNPFSFGKDISLDFMEGLPQSGGKHVILVVVNRLSKYAHFLSLSHPYMALDVAKLFFNNVYKLHGMPSTIISDMDPIFLSTVWIFFPVERCSLEQINCPSSSNRWPNEVVNICLETYLLFTSYPIVYLPSEITNVTFARSLEARESVIKFLQFHLLLAQNGMAQQENKHWIDRSFTLGD